jgi:hypothetical protein
LSCARGFAAVWEYLEKCPPSFIPSLDPNGFSLEIAQPCLSPWARNFFEAAEVEAKRLFLGLSASEWNYRVCRCRYLPCSQYFLLDKPRALYRSGTFCGRRHQSPASANKAMREKRKRCESKLIDLAVGRLHRRKISGPQWQQDKTLKLHLANEVSSAISTGKDPNLKAYRPAVKLNWITHNQHLIEQKRIKLQAAKNPRV